MNCRKYSVCLSALFILLGLFLTRVNAQISIQAGSIVSENFNAMANSETASLPTNWKVSKSGTARTVGTFSAAATVTEQIQQLSSAMSSSAATGVYNFYSSGESCVGGLCSTSSPKSISVMTSLKNIGSASLNSFVVSFDAKRFRNGSNSTGFSIQMYYSTNGTSWTSAGSDFLLSFAANANNNGSTTNPMETKSVSNKLFTQTLAAGSTLYLAWCYSVVSGTTTSSPQALAVDNITINCSPIISAPSTLDLLASCKGTSSSTLTVIGRNLTGNVTSAITGTNASYFSISPASLTAAGGDFTITYNPLTAGPHTATLTLLSAGAANKVVTLNGSVKADVAATSALAATAVSTSDFTANWSAVSGADQYSLSVYQGVDQFAADLIISEYIEGSSNNRAIELFNGTANPVDLSQYKIEFYANGSSTATNSLSLTGSLASGATYVIVNNSANATLTSKANLLNTTVMSFNGNDAIALRKGTAYVDIIGQIGTDPGSAWTAGSLSTADQTLRRKSSVLSGVSANPASGFPTLATEWVSYATDNSDDLGMHTMALSYGTLVSGYPVTINAPSTSYQVTGLSPATTYSYAVKTIMCAQTGGSVNAITVTTNSASHIAATPDPISITTAACSSTAKSTVNVTGTGLSSTISATLGGTNASLFSLSASSLPVAGGALEITYAPLTEGVHTATLTLTSGATTKTITITGTATTPLIATPTNLFTSDLTQYSFKANWGQVPRATSYSVTVNKVAGVGASSLSEQFSGSAALVTSTDNWESNSTLGYDTSGDYGVAAPALQLSTNNAFVQSMLLSADITNVSFWVKKKASANTSSLLVKASADGLTWSTVHEIPFSDLPETGVTMSYSLTSPHSIPSGTRAVQLMYNKVNGDVAIDDIELLYGGYPDVPVAGSPFTVNGSSVSLSVTGLTANTSYQYVVQSVGCSQTSGNSAVKEVHTLLYPCTVPVNLSSSNVAARSATLSWDTDENATYDLFLSDLGAEEYEYLGVKPPFNVTGLTPGTTYFWDVKESSTTCVSEIFEFTTSTNITPTIVVNDVADKNMYTQIGGSDTEVIEVLGENLTANITLSTTAPFSVSEATLTQSNGIVPKTSITITYAPTSVGPHNGTLTLSSAGATPVVINLIGETCSAPATPEVLEATNVSTTGFTANWQSVPNATQYLVKLYKEGGTTSDLLISQYYECAGYNKAIEIFNGTANDVDLSGYSLKLSRNGNATFNEGPLTFPSGTMVKANDAFLVVNYRANSPMPAMADLTTSSQVIDFNGNDPVALYKGNTVIDVVGYLGSDQYWGKTKTWIRKDYIQAPNTSFTESEWRVYAVKVAGDSLGHFKSNRLITLVTEVVVDAPNTSTLFSGLQENQNYVYTVEAIGACGTSEVSTEIEVFTVGGVASVTRGGTKTYFSTIAAAVADAQTDGSVVKMETNTAEGLLFDGTLNVNGNDKVIGTLTVGPNDVLIMSPEQLRVNRLILKSDPMGGPQIKNVDSDTVIKVMKRICYDKKLYSSQPNKWTPFSVPFTPDACVALNGGVEQAMIFDTDYMIGYYDSSQRASKGLTYAWTPISALSILVPTEGYIISTNAIEEVRFSLNVPLAGRAVSNTKRGVSVYQFLNSGTGTVADAGWNYVSQPVSELSYWNGGGSQYFQVFNTLTDTYTPIEANSNVMPYTPFFYQASGDNNLVFENAINSNNPIYRSVSSNSEERFKFSFGEVGETYKDYLFVSCSAESDLNTYEIGKDVTKFVSGKYPLIWSADLGLRLCANDVVRVGDVARANVTVKVPKAGRYVMAMEQASSNAQLYLFDKGVPVWRMSDGDYLFDAAAGEYNGFEIRIMYTPTEHQVNVTQNLIAYCDKNSIVVDGLLCGEVYDVYDINGRSMASGCATDSRVTVPVQVSGFYMVVVSGEQGKRSAKVICKLL